MIIANAYEQTTEQIILKPKTYIDDPRTIAIRMLLIDYQSPMIESAHVFVQEADKNHIDWRLLASIAGIESVFGKRIPNNSFNAWGWAVYTGKSTGAVFLHWDEAIVEISSKIKESYYDKGANTPETIGRSYAADPAWASKVQFFIDKLNHLYSFSSNLSS